VGHSSFPNCIGSVAGSRVRIVKQSDSGSVYYSYQFFSIVLLAICDAVCSSTFIDIVAYNNSDSFIFKKRGIEK